MSISSSRREHRPYYRSPSGKALSPPLFITCHKGSNWRRTYHEMKATIIQCNVVNGTLSRYSLGVRFNHLAAGVRGRCSAAS